MKTKLLLASLSMIVVAAFPSISGARVGLKGDDKYTVAYSSYFPGGKTSTKEKIPPRRFLLNCLNVYQSTVNRNWASVTFRYPWALQHPGKCPRRFLGNGLTLMYSGSTEFWERTLQGPYDENACPTYKPDYGPRMPFKVGRDLFGKEVCP